MKNAPNLKKQPADLMEESIIFAGADAWTFAKAWQEMNPIGDTVPPVVLDKKQLAELENIRIVDDGRLYARVCRGGHLTERQITILATKLAVAGVEPLAFLEGAANAYRAFDLRAFENPVWMYAGARYALCNRGRTNEFLLTADGRCRALGGSRRCCGGCAAAGWASFRRTSACRRARTRSTRC